jgi:8-oxo-dGTP pyrophosphatase MutT (NUDIX family)
MPDIRQAGGVIILGDRVVLRRTAAGEWVFPKGHIEAGETAEQAAIRETEEETGLRANIYAALDEYIFQFGGATRRVEMFLLLADSASPDWAQHEGVDAFAVPLDEVEERLSFSSLKDFWRQAILTTREALAKA